MVVIRLAKTALGFRALLFSPVFCCFDREQLLAVRFVARGASAGSASACVRALALFFCKIFRFAGFSLITFLCEG